MFISSLLFESLAGLLEISIPTETGEDDLA